MIRRLFFSAVIGAVFVLGLANTQAQVTPLPGREPTAPPAGSLLSRVRGLFDIDLPQIDPPGTFKVILHPHLGDLVHRDYLRVTTGLQWALNDHLELRAEADLFGRHGLRRSTTGYGNGQMHYGVKYVFPRRLHPDLETSIGLTADTPVGRPPIDFTDGHNHYTPYVIVQHHTNFNPRLTTFGGVNVDFVTAASVPGVFGTNVPHDDSLGFTAGVIYDLGQIKWTLAGTYTTTALISRDAQHFFTLRPSLLWYVPKQYLFNWKTQWIVGLGVRSTWGPDGYDLGTSSRVRAELTFGQVMRTIGEKVLPSH